MQGRHLEQNLKRRASNMKTYEEMAKYVLEVRNETDKRESTG